jgi:hypothetical protein
MGTALVCDLHHKREVTLCSLVELRRLCGGTSGEFSITRVVMEAYAWDLPPCSLLAKKRSLRGTTLGRADCTGLSSDAINNNIAQAYTQQSETIPVRGRGSPRCLDDRLTDGGEVVSLTHRPHSTPETVFSASGFHVC